ncbi:hypothetical protein ACGFJ7_31460 [Actinoplanes sp. NPDC048988]|uniref:hypothetical protein n=1 Tax=Actinoplanes sp. NPDC048988 TaxID=3363901 RepID=UPI003710F60E
MAKPNYGSRTRLLPPVLGLLVGGAMMAISSLYWSESTGWKFGAFLLTLMFGAGLVVEAFRDLWRVLQRTKR